MTDTELLDFAEKWATKLKKERFGTKPWSFQADNKAVSAPTLRGAILKAAREIAQRKDV